MILNQDIRPEKQAYYLGSKILAALREEDDEEIDLLDLFEKINREDRISYNAFSMAMNWLYLIGAVKLEQRTLIKCF